MELESNLKLQSDNISSTIHTVILKAELCANPILYNFKILSRVLFDSDPISDQDDVYINKFLYICDLNLFNELK